MSVLGVVTFSFQAMASLNEGLTSVTLSDALKSALKKTEVIALGQSRVDQAQARVDQTRAKFFPVLSFSASDQLQDTGGVLSRQSSSLFGGRQSYARLSLSQSIYEGGRDDASWNAALSEKEAQTQNQTQQTLILLNEVARAFYAILSTDQEVKTLKKTIELAEARIREITSRTQIGRSRKTDLLAAQTQWSVLDAQRAAAEGQLVLAREQFVLVTGLPRDIQLVESKDQLKFPDNVDTYLSRLELRPDLVFFQARVESAQKGIEIASAGHLPSISMGGNYYLLREGTQKGNHWDVSATLSFPLFSGGSVSAQVRESILKLNEAELLLIQSRRQAETAIRTAYSHCVSALEQMRSLETAIRFAEENYREQEKNYRFGQATNLDVIQALNVFQDTKRTLDRTRYQALSAWAELKAATAQEVSDS